MALNDDIEIITLHDESKIALAGWDFNPILKQ